MIGAVPCWGLCSMAIVLGSPARFGSGAFAQANWEAEWEKTL
jgi:hypothetical protein